MPNHTQAGPAPIEAGDFVIYPQRKLFEAGVYKDKAFSLSPEEMLEKTIPSFKAAPLDLEHISTVIKDEDLGHVTRIYTPDAGKTLLADVAVPKWLAPHLKPGETNLSATFDRATKAIRKTALTLNPRVKDAALFTEEVLAAFSVYKAGQTTSGKEAEEAAAREQLLAEFKKYTWEGRDALQIIHDAAAGRGARCVTGMANGTDADPTLAGGNEAAFVTSAEARALQTMHDMAVKNGATCNIRDDSKQGSRYFNEEAAPAGEDKRVMSKVSKAVAAFTDFLRGKGKDVPDAEVAEFLGGGLAPAGQSKDADGKPINTPDTSGQMQGGQPMAKGKKRKSSKKRPTTQMSKADQAAWELYKRAHEAQFADGDGPPRMKKWEFVALRASLAPEQKAVQAQFAAAQHALDANKMLGEVDQLVREFRISPAQGSTYKELIQESPASFAKILPALKATPPNPAVVGFSSDAELPQGIDAELVVAQMNEERPDNSLATFANKIQQENPSLSAGEALMEAARRNPALVQNRQMNTPVLG